MRVALITTDGREILRDYAAGAPSFGTAPEALMQGFAKIDNLEVHVVSCVQNQVTSPVKLAENVWFHSLHVPRIGWLRTGYQGCIRAVRRLLKTIRPDIVHGQGTERECALSAVFSGFPNVVTIHGNMGELARLFKPRVGSYGWLTARLEEFTLPRTAGVFCNSAYTEELVRSRSRKTWRVPNPIRLAFLETTATCPRTPQCSLLNVGVISPRKRQLEILGLAGRLHASGFAIRFDFVGQLDSSDPYAAEFKRQISIAEQAGYARHLGVLGTEELIACFDRSSALIHFPTEEAFGLVVAEALARNLKFFGARVGGITEIASNAPQAELLAAHDWSGLGAAIVSWFEKGHPPANGGNELMGQRYHPEIIARQHARIYEEVLSKV